MHGGAIYLRGGVSDFQLGREVGRAELTEADRKVVTVLVGQFGDHFGLDAQEIMKQEFTKLFPRWLRPYGRLYAY
jgi:glutamate synthase domain-containing protein 3